MSSTPVFGTQTIVEEASPAAIERVMWVVTVWWLCPGPDGM